LEYDYKIDKDTKEALTTEYNTDKDQNNSTVTEYNISDIKAFIVQSRKHKHKQHTIKLKALNTQAVAPTINLTQIDSTQIENERELICWLKKLNSKKNYLVRKSLITMNNPTANHNRFGALASSISEDEIDVTTSPSTEPESPDIITTITGESNQITLTTNLQSNPGPNTIMTQTPRSSIAPPLPTVQPWQKVGEKQDAKEERYNNEEYSNRFAPMYLPPLPKYDKEWNIEKYTKKILPVTVRVTAPKNYKVKNGRVIIAILRALQKIDPSTYIGPIVTTTNNDNILHPRQVPPDEDSLNYYLEEPTTGRYKKYSARIYICTNHELEFYKKRTRFDRLPSWRKHFT
jgi:hypothetical protein